MALDFLSLFALLGSAPCRVTQKTGACGDYSIFRKYAMVSTHFRCMVGSLTSSSPEQLCLSGMYIYVSTVLVSFLEFGHVIAALLTLLFSSFWGKVEIEEC